MTRITFYFLFFWAVSITAQSSWKKLNSKSATNNKKLISRKSSPKNFNLYNLDVASFKEKIKSQQTIAIPNSKGEVINFRLNESSSFTRKVSEKYGQITSYSLTSLDNSTTKGKISIGYDGVHVMILSDGASTFYIDPYTEDKSTYITYSKNELTSNEGIKCLVDGNDEKQQFSSKSSSAKTNGDGIIRTYRLALASTGEYSEFHYTRNGLTSNASDDDKKASILSAMNTTITRINGIFEKDLGVKMEIVLNNNGENELIFLDANTDNLTNSDAFELINESQTICDDVIGNNNYDIGHTFSTGAGGLAAVGSICLNGAKAQGVTGGSFPIGDAFDVDFVAHELGHQFGANHSYNSSCEENRWGPTAVEPASGTTIMSYAGICPPNIQNNVDDYFHAISLEQMWTVIQNTSCATTNNIGNSTPITNAGADVSVPKSTPLILKGEATDSDGNLLTYTWEQMDNEIATMPPLSTNIAGPAFRSFPPSINSERYLPTLATVISGSTENQWEVIPSVAREMNFTLTVRDNEGSFAQDDLSINVIDTDPFTVTSQNTASIWNVGTNETITWNKSTTDQAPINCQNVSIKLSTDGGLSFPITLVESTPNDGIADIVVPNETTSNARIMIVAVNNIFYNVNSTNITIQSTEPAFVLSNISESQETCVGENTSIQYIFNIDYINEFSETVTLSANNLPTNTNAELSTSTINGGTEVTLTISNINSVEIGDYNISIIATSTSITNSNLELPTLSVLNNTFGDISNVLPENNSTLNSTANLNFEWTDENGNATLFDLEIANDVDFTSNLILIENIENLNYTLEENLNQDIEYYWRVKPKNNCASGEYSEIYSFSIPKLTEYCNSFFTETGDREYISNVSLEAINNDSSLDDNGYGDYTSITSALKIGETYTLSVTFDPDGFQDHCFVFIDWNNDFYFDPNSERYDLGTSLNGASTTKTTNITVPNNTPIGDLRMRVIIEYFTDTLTYGTGACDSDHNSEFGETEDYTLRIIENIEGYDDVFSTFLMFPNPITTEEIATNKLHILFDIPNTDELIILNFFNIYGELVANRNYESLISDEFNQNINLDNFSAGIYILNIQNGPHSTTKKIIVR